MELETVGNWRPPSLEPSLSVRVCSNIAIAPYVAFNNITAYIQFISKTTMRSFSEKIGKIDQDKQFWS